MSRGWNYSNLVHTAKLCGGPEKYINRLVYYGVQEGIKKGRVEMIPLIIVSGVVGGGATYLGCKVLQSLKAQMPPATISKEEACEAKNKLLNEIYSNGVEKETVTSEDEVEKLVMIVT